MKQTKKRNSRVFVLAIIVVALCAITLPVSVQAQGSGYVDENGTAIENWTFDANGISKEVVYTETDGIKTAVTGYGMHDAATFYSVGNGVSGFVMMGGYFIAVGGQLDVAKPIEFTFQTENWAGTGKFLIGGFTSYEDLFATGPNA